MAGTPDRNGPNMAFIPDTAENSNAQYPFHVAHNSGYFTLDPPPDNVAGEATDVVFIPPYTWHPASVNTEDCSTIIGSIPAPVNVLITPYGFVRYADGFDQPYTGSAEFSDLVYEQGLTYKWEFSSADNHQITMKVYSINGGNILAETTLNSTGMFIDGDDNPIPIAINLGYPTREQLNATPIYGNPPTPYKGADGLLIVTAYKTVGPTIAWYSVNANPQVGGRDLTIPVGTAADTYLTDILVNHPNQIDGFKFTLTGGDSAMFKVIGNQLYTAADLTTADTLGFDLNVADKFGKSWGAASAITVA